MFGLDMFGYVITYRNSDGREKPVRIRHVFGLDMAGLHMFNCNFKK